MNRMLFGRRRRCLIYIMLFNIECRANYFDWQLQPRNYRTQFQSRFVLFHSNYSLIIINQSIQIRILNLHLPSRYYNYNYIQLQSAPLPPIVPIVLADLVLPRISRTDEFGCLTQERRG